MERGVRTANHNDNPTDLLRAISCCESMICSKTSFVIAIVDIFVLVDTFVMVNMVVIVDMFVMVNMFDTVTMRCGQWFV